MKLILVPSNPNHGPRVAISVPQDGGDIDEFLSQVVAPALVAFGYHPQTIQDAMHRVDVPGAEDEEPLEPDDLTEWSTTPEPAVDLPELPPVPKGFDSWSEPALVPQRSRPCEGPMGFFHADPDFPDDDWIVSTGGTYGGPTHYPVYFIKAAAKPVAKFPCDPPEGFTIVGYNVSTDERHPDGELLWHDTFAWHETNRASGDYVWYAARTGSETLAKLQAHLAAL